MKKGNQIYLDYNATTPVLPEVLEAMYPFYKDQFANPSSDHIWGWEADEAVDLARTKIARILKANKEEIYFFSGATEAINTAIIGYALQNKKKGNHIITCKTEHKAVLASCAWLEKNGYTITYLEVDANGQLFADMLVSSITDETIMICLMLANNETGIIHPVAELMAAVQSNDKIIWMVDATQAVGKIPFSVLDLPADLIVFSGHKIYGPKGSGVLYKSGRKNIHLASLSFGGVTEKGLRSGTQNVPAVIGLARALEICQSDLTEESARVRKLITSFEKSIYDTLDVVINGGETGRIPNTSNLTFMNIDHRNLLRKLKPLALSQGSACSALQSKPSHVLLAMGLTADQALSSVRISIGRFTTEAHIMNMLDVFYHVIPGLKK